MGRCLGLLHWIDAPYPAHYQGSEATRMPDNEITITGYVLQNQRTGQFAHRISPTGSGDGGLFVSELTSSLLEARILLSKPQVLDERVYRIRKVRLTLEE
jgi:hypothetical protein